MKYDGKYEFAGHTYPGCTFTALKYAGRNQKPILTREALKRDVKIVNRVLVFDLIRDDAVIGAIGVHTREDKIIEFRAKSVIIATGGCKRLYPGPTPSWMFNQPSSPACTGDGRAMAYRAGAELLNMEGLHRQAGPKYFAKSGKGTWIGVIRNPDGKPVGPFVTKPDRQYGDVLADAYKSVFEDYAKSGHGPVYMDCRGISDEDYEYMTYWLEHEGNIALLNNLKEDGVDLRKNPVEFMSYEFCTRGGINYNERGKTSVKGLYAAGDEYVGGISGAATFGWMAGENAAKYVQEDAPEVDAAKEKTEIETMKDLLSSIRSREIGATWQEANVALQQIMQDYAGHIRSEFLLRAGLSHLRRLKEKVSSSMMAKNQHELMHCLEVLNLLDIGEVVFIAAIQRKETRGSNVRVDYPFTNPLMEKMLICRKVNDNPTTEWREIES